MVEKIAALVAELRIKNKSLEKSICHLLVLCGFFPEGIMKLGQVEQSFGFYCLFFITSNDEILN